MSALSRAGSAFGFGQEEQRRLDALADVLGVGEAELEEDRVDVLLDRPLGEDERVGDRRVALALGDLGEDLALARRSARPAASARRAAWRRRAARRSSSPCTEPPAATASIAATQLGAVVDALLEQVGAALGAGLEQRQRVGGLGVVGSGRRRRSPGASRAAARPARMPSSVLVGGIRMSVTTTSGRSLSTAASSEGRSPHEATTSHRRARRPGSARRPRGRSGCHRPRRWQRAYTVRIARCGHRRIGRMVQVERDIRRGRPRVIWRRLRRSGPATSRSRPPWAVAHEHPSPALARSVDARSRVGARAPARRPVSVAASSSSRRLTTARRSSARRCATRPRSSADLAAGRPRHRRALPVGPALVAGRLHRRARRQRPAARRAAPAAAREPARPAGGQHGRGRRGALLLRRLIGPRAAMDRAEQVGGLFAALAVATAISATVGMVSMLAGGVITAVEAPTFWRTWWLGDVAGRIGRGAPGARVGQRSRRRVAAAADHRGRPADRRRRDARRARRVHRASP